METTTALLPIVALVVLVLVALGGSARVIPQDQALVVFRLGKFAGVQHTGRRVLIPLVDQGVWVDLKPQSDTFPDIELLLQDRESAFVDLDYTYRIIDPAASVIQVANAPIAIRKLLQTTLQTLAANEKRDDILKHRKTIERELISRTQPTFASWGIELQSVSLHNLE